MRILVTGGAGFIGSHIVEQYLRKGHEVWAIDDLATGQELNLPKDEKLRFGKGKLSEYPQLEEAVAWSERIFHAAATVGMKNVLQNPTYTFSNNLHAMDALFSAMKKHKNGTKLLFLSSSGVYWNSKTENGVFSEKTPLLVQPEHFKQEPYSLSKIAGEVMTLAFCDEHDIDCKVARIFNTVGVRQTGKYGMVVPRLVSQAFKNEPLTVFGDGKQTRSFINVHDTVEAITLLIENDAAKAEIVNVGNDREISILQLAQIVKEVLGSRSEIVFVPYKEAYGMDFIDVRNRRPCIDKLRKLTGFTPKWTIEETVAEVAASMQNTLSTKMDN